MKKRLEKAAEAIAIDHHAEEWQLGEIDQGMKDLDSGRTVSEEDVSKWVRSWGRPGERKAPR